MNTVYTIGHSTHPIDEFVSLLKNYQIELVADIRSIPRSRHNPQFNEETLKKTLEAEGIKYVRLTKLGGLRHAVKDSVNLAWKNLSFRGFADYMQSAEFEAGMDELAELAKNHRVAIMCAEAVPWRCHRSLVGDALLVRGIRVEDILEEGKSREHRLTPWAKVEGKKITYPE